MRREINWDGVPDNRSDPTSLPFDFFNVNSPRGAVFSTVGAGNSGRPALLRDVAAPPGDCVCAPPSGRWAAIYQQIAGPLGG